MAPEVRRQRVELDFSDELLLENPGARVLDEFGHQHATRMARRVHVDQRVRADVEQSCIAQHAWRAQTDGAVDAALFCVAFENPKQSALGGMGRITTLCRRFCLMKRHHAAGPDEPHHLRNDLLGLRNVDEHEARGREIEGARWKAGVAGIGKTDFDVRQCPLGDDLPRALDLLVAPLDTDDPAPGADALGEKVEATERATADLDHAPAFAHSDLVE